MLGINDIGIILPYLLSAVCLIFALWYGITYWNQEDSPDDE